MDGSVLRCRVLTRLNDWTGEEDKDEDKGYGLGYCPVLVASHALVKRIYGLFLFFSLSSSLLSSLPRSVGAGRVFSPFSFLFPVVCCLLGSDGTASPLMRIMMVVTALLMPASCDVGLID